MKRKEIKMSKSILSILTVLTMLFAMISSETIIYGSDLRASTYLELTGALASASEGDTINITSDIIVTAEISVSKTVTINGNGHTLSVPVTGLDESGKLADSPSTWRVFSFSANDNVEVNNMIIKGGRPNSDGGAITVNRGTTLKLNNVTISNSGGGSLAAGGGIDNEGILYLNSCSIKRNGGHHGGGFLNSGTMFIEESTFSENRSLASTGGGGAGENSGTLYINNSTFANNVSTELGSALNIYGGTAYILNSTFTGNINSHRSYSGVIRSSSSTRIINSIFAYNYYTADDGDSYSLNDFDGRYSDGNLIYSIYSQSDIGTTASGMNLIEGNNNYSGNITGADDSLTSGGSTTKLLAADGTLSGDATIYQPYLVSTDGDKPPVIVLKQGSFAYDKGTITAFSAEDNPTIAYKDSNNDWIYILGNDKNDADDHIVSHDQLGNLRTTNTVGATVQNGDGSYMLRVLANNDGSVLGGSIFGDLYASGSLTTVIAYPNEGKTFVGWIDSDSQNQRSVAVNDVVVLQADQDIAVNDLNVLTNDLNVPTNNAYVSTNNLYTFTMDRNITLTPVYADFAGYTLTYSGNGNTGGLPPSPQTVEAGSVTVSANSNLVKEGYDFVSWNTSAAGDGTTYNANDSNDFVTNTFLYAIWAKSIETVTVEAFTYATDKTSIKNILATNGLELDIRAYSGLDNIGKDEVDTEMYNGRSELTSKGVIQSKLNTAVGNAQVDSDAREAQEAEATRIAAELVRAKEAVEALNEESYTPSTWEAITSASALPEDTDQNKLDKTSAINSAIAGLSLNAPVDTSSSTSNPKPMAPPVEVMVNGEARSIGKTNEVIEGGKTTTRLVVNGVKLDEELSGEDEGMVICTEFKNDANKVVSEFNGQMVKDMEDKHAIIEVKTETEVYTLPSEQIDIDDISKQLGEEVELKDIIVDIEISKASETSIKFLEDLEESGKYTVVTSPVDFNITCCYNNKSVEVSKFKIYVERMVEIPSGVDIDKITTGVVIEADGSLRHVPTKVIVKDGKFYAQINSLTNSTYSVIWNPIEFKDLVGHWGEDTANNMGSRMIIDGNDDLYFEPENNITRGEFTSYIVKALGLEAGVGTNIFSDVSSSDDYFDYIVTAITYDLIQGNGKGEFNGEDIISREEAMLMITRSLKIAGIDLELCEEEVDEVLSDYQDSSDINWWAQEGIAGCIKGGIIIGKHDNYLDITTRISKIEVATMIERLLEKANLI